MYPTTKGVINSRLRRVHSFPSYHTKMNRVFIGCQQTDLSGGEGTHLTVTGLLTAVGKAHRDHPGSVEAKVLRQSYFEQ